MLLMLNVCRIADAVALPGACLRTEAVFKGFVILQKQVTKYAKSGDISTKTEEIGKKNSFIWQTTGIKQILLMKMGHYCPCLDTGVWVETVARFAIWWPSI